MHQRRALLAAPLLIAAAPAAEGGELALDNTPALASHKMGVPADNPDLLLRWNAPREGPLDRVLHFHGFSNEDPRQLDLRAAMPGSGLDLVPVPEARSRLPGRPSATLALLPRGRPRPRDRLPGPFDWPAISAPGALAAILDAGMRAMAAHVGRPLSPPGQLILTAHSGGGGGLLAALDQAAREVLRVDQVFCYDALYRDPAPVIRWAKATPGSVLVVIHTPGGRNTENARRVKAEVPQARIYASEADHADIPRANGWRLLIDPMAALI
ncbi:MAG: hypothetical protein JWR00_1636 [Rubritepida sp.]|nr:hypothetical protein [Rubritepida sp.]